MAGRRGPNPFLMSVNTSASVNIAETEFTYGGPEGIRTLGRSIKSRALYLAELQAPSNRLYILFSYKPY